MCTISTLWRNASSGVHRCIRLFSWISRLSREGVWIINGAVIPKKLSCWELIALKTGVNVADYPRTVLMALS